MNDLTDNLERLTNQLKPHFKPGFLQQNNVIFQFQFEVGEKFHLLVRDGQFQFAAGEHKRPTITLFLDYHDTAHQLLRGSMDGMQAFMEGKYRADGNIVLSQLLLYLFKPDDPTSFYQVRD
ncbi:MAG: SCP2 sterol-binding domain-containing protein [Gammaproteobacteria bacterium]|nr:SCP2 sterol-binding domain-containing protein [Gammaproteobacteria bacterium]